MWGGGSSCGQRCSVVGGLAVGRGVVWWGV